MLLDPSQASRSTPLTGCALRHPVAAWNQSPDWLGDIGVHPLCWRWHRRGARVVTVSFIVVDRRRAWTIVDRSEVADGLASVDSDLDFGAQSWVGMHPLRRLKSVLRLARPNRLVQ